MGSSGITFTGSSTYSSSFQQVIQRAVNIASLPLQSLQSSVSTLKSQQSAIASLGSSFTTLHGAIQQIATAAGANATASVSNSSSVSATASSGALPGVYSIQVDDPGSSTTTLSKSTLTTVTDPATGDISSATSFTLTVNGAAHTVTNTGNSLSGLAEIINAGGYGVQATIVNLGGSSNPDYRLALTGTQLGSDTIQLTDGSNDLLDTLSTGAPAQYKINGGTTDVQSNSSQVAIAPGVTINLLAQSTSPVKITVSRSFSTVQSALSSFVSAYNSAFDALAQNRGQNGGALSGDSLVFTLTNVLRQVSQYQAGSGTISSLSDLGLTLDDTGHLSLDTSALANPNAAALSHFLGDTISGGFLKAANDAVNGITDSTKGLVATDYNNLGDQITNLNAQVADQQSKITDLENNLQAQLSQADAAIATLQSQKTYFQELFQATYGTPSSNA